MASRRWRRSSGCCSYDGERITDSRWRFRGGGAPMAAFSWGTTVVVFQWRLCDCSAAATGRQNYHGGGIAASVFRASINRHMHSCISYFIFDKAD
eukprot:IDg4041t1